jgi:3-deoxy-D-manno-octulosonic-acid transferase
VLFGPRHDGSRDAGLLIDEDAAVSVADADSLLSAMERWLDSSAERSAAGEAALRVVHRGLGAAEKSYAMVRELLG